MMMMRGNQRFYFIKIQNNEDNLILISWSY